MAENNFLIFNEANNPDVTMSDTAYADDPYRQNGLIPMIADPNAHNKMYRQWSVMAKAIGDFVKDEGFNALDTDAEALTENISEAIGSRVESVMEQPITNITTTLDSHIASTPSRTETVHDFSEDSEGNLLYKNNPIGGGGTGDVAWGDSSTTAPDDPRNVEYNTTWANQMTGTGTEQDPYLINTPYDLNLIRNNLTAHYKLMNHIDLTDAIGLGINEDYSGWDTAKDNPSAPLWNAGKGWAPIPAGSTLATSFTGTIDGNSKRVKGLAIKNNVANVGFLSGRMSGVIKNLILESGLIENANTNTFALAQQITDGGLVEDFINYVNIIVTGTGSYTSGLAIIVGKGTLRRCGNRGNISGYSWVAGLVSSAYQTSPGATIIEDCFNAGNIAGNANYRVGGIVGELNNSSAGSTITNCVNMGKVIGSVSAQTAGRGIVGEGNTGTFPNNFSIAEKSANDNINPPRWINLPEGLFMAPNFTTVMGLEAFNQSPYFNDNLPFLSFEFTPPPLATSVGTVIAGDKESGKIYETGINFEQLASKNDLSAFPKLPFSPTLVSNGHMRVWNRDASPAHSNSYVCGADRLKVQGGTAATNKYRRVKKYEVGGVFYGMLCYIATSATSDTVSTADTGLYQFQIMQENLKLGRLLNVLDAFNKLTFTVKYAMHGGNFVTTSVTKTKSQILQDIPVNNFDFGYNNSATFNSLQFKVPSNCIIAAMKLEEGDKFTGWGANDESDIGEYWQAYSINQDCRITVPTAGVARVAEFFLKNQPTMARIPSGDLEKPTTAGWTGAVINRLAEGTSASYTIPNPVAGGEYNLSIRMKQLDAENYGLTPKT